MPRGSKGTKEAKRRVVARGIVKGKTTKAIAREAGCAERHVERLAAEPATEFLITEIMRPHRERLEKLAKKSIDAVDEALSATYIKGKPNHEIRLRAVRRYRDLAEMAQGKPSDELEQTSGLVTWEEFVVLYRRRTDAASPTAEPAPLG